MTAIPRMAGARGRTSGAPLPKFVIYCGTL